MTVLRHFLRYALAAIGWAVDMWQDATMVATDLHGRRYRITVTQCD